MIAILFAASLAMSAADTIIEREVMVPGPVELPGTLTLPGDGQGPWPAVVIVHGSGGGDRDGTLGPNKPYRDLAHGLARRGIAVLRYDKRTGINPLWYMNRTFTVREEVLDDALSALQLLRATPEVDSSAIFVAGHSLGGILAPRIAAEDGRLAGIVMMAGATLVSIPENILRQLDYLATVSSTADSTRIVSQRAAVGAMVQMVRNLTSGDSAQAALILGAPASYWLDLRAYNPATVLASLEQPALILQGERDYQVTPAQLDEFLVALGDREALTVRRYPLLNHLLIEGEGPPSNKDYSKSGAVSDQVIADIADWIASVTR